MKKGKGKSPDNTLLMLAKAKGIVLTPEHRFHSVRKWRFDYADVEHKIAVEIEGGVWIRGRHSRGAGMIKDMEKYNTATLMGWRVLRYTPQNIYDAVEDMVKLREII